MAAHDHVLLGKGNDVVGDPVHHQPAGKTAQHEHENPGHPGKDHLLRRVGGGWVQLLLQPHRNAQQDRQHTDKDQRHDRPRHRHGPGKQSEQVVKRRRVRCRKVGQPTKERRVTQLQSDENHLVERKENRNLNQDRQTACRRIDLLILVQLHHFALHQLFIGARAFFQSLHFGLQFLHSRHRDVRFVRQRQHEKFQHESQPDDGQTHIANQTI